MVLNSRHVRAYPTVSYVNRTRLYLAPTVNTLPKYVIQSINRLNVHMWGVNDVLYEYVGATKTKHLLFMLVVVPQGRNAIAQFKRDVGVLRGFENYVDDYCFNFRQRKLHMIVLHVGSRWRRAYSNFIEGKFSEMFSTTDLNTVQITEFTRTGQLNQPWVVLTKDQRYKQSFQSQIKQFFGTQDVPDELDEYDSFTIYPTSEVFNAKPGKPCFLSSDASLALSIE